MNAIAKARDTLARLENFKVEPRVDREQWQLPSEPKPRVTTDAMLMLQMREHVRDQLDQAADDIGAEVGLIERRIVQRQDEEIAALRVELQVMRSQIAELRDIVDGLQAEVAAVEDDVAASERSAASSVVKLRGAK